MTASTVLSLLEFSPNRKFSAFGTNLQEIQRNHLSKMSISSETTIVAKAQTLNLKRKFSIRNRKNYLQLIVQITIQINYLNNRKHHP